MKIYPTWLKNEEIFFTQCLLLSSAQGHKCFDTELLSDHSKTKVARIQTGPPRKHKVFGKTEPYLRTTTTSTEIVDLWHCYKTRFFSFENTFFVTMYTVFDSRKEFSLDQTFLYIIYLTSSQWCFRAKQASEMMFSPTKSNQQLQVQVITDLN